MSDVWGQLKDMKALVAALVAGAIVCMAIGGALMEWRIGVAVAAELAKQDLGTDSKIVSMDDEIDANGAAAAANTTRIDGNERRVEQAFGILVGRPVPDND